MEKGEAIISGFKNSLLELGFEAISEDEFIKRRQSVTPEVLWNNMATPRELKPFVKIKVEKITFQVYGIGSGGTEYKIIRVPLADLPTVVISNFLCVVFGI